MTQPAPTTRPAPSTALITGASSGIGEQIAMALAARGSHLILVARSEGPLNALADTLRTRHGVQVHVLPQDLTRPHAARDLLDRTQALNLNVDILVNNAGFADYGEFTELDVQKQLDMIQVNITALTELTHAYLPGMRARGRGRVLNIASTAAFLPGPLMAVYYATKAYVLSFSEALHEELRGTGVSVTAACPGPVETGFQAAANMGGSRLLRDRLTRAAILPAREVAAQAVTAMLRGEGVHVIGTVNRLQTLLPRLLPRRAVPPLIRRVQGQH
ncbi:SDR family NAD(P)-dependent oxidoreductase [Deinococcus soli (ex Cha et al. 2016)]|uniref:Short-chain dehydrogenase n=1 Tax=Deinococcus soli (ex Cha et al. 2016) TaxID=1309411 RepID=A0A0F7JRL8_9DEIO|nr:SDR family oxidoreductase [Deinococcus soli (ex Cha et al. 2016)]AKH17235.1 short-chain dehydrogenase [Deinococcus soli (ex Cha et al. 2016)]